MDKIALRAARYIDTVRAHLNESGQSPFTRADFDCIVDRIVADAPMRENYHSARAFRRAMRRHRPV